MLKRILRWLWPIDENPRPNPIEHPRVDLGPYVERLGIVEGEIAGIKIALESLGESLHKQVAKWNTRTRREAEKVNEEPQRDPRVEMLMKQRGLIP